MTQQDKDRDAFEGHARSRGLNPTPSYDDSGSYRHSDTNTAWRAWQAARDHYAPKLTPEQATVALARFVALQEYHSHGFETIDSPEVYVGIAYKDHIDSSRKEIEALRAAGVRFKEEA